MHFWPRKKNMLQAFVKFLRTRIVYYLYDSQKSLDEICAFLRKKKKKTWAFCIYLICSRQTLEFQRQRIEVLQKGAPTLDVLGVLALRASPLLLALALFVDEFFPARSGLVLRGRTGQKSFLQRLQLQDRSVHGSKMIHQFLNHVVGKCKKIGRTKKKS